MIEPTPVSASGRVGLDGNPVPPPLAEWIEADGLGGYAMGTVCGLPTRRYHGILQPALQPPTGRMNLVQAFRLHSPDNTQIWPVGMGGSAALFSFRREPWPTWILAAPGGGRLQLEVVVLHEKPWTIIRLTGGVHPIGFFGNLTVELDFTGRDYHGPLLEEVPDWSVSLVPGGALVKRTDGGDGDLPSVRVASSGYLSELGTAPAPKVYVEESQRGLDDRERTFTPVGLNLDFHGSESSTQVIMLGIGDDLPPEMPRTVTQGDIRGWANRALEVERGRRLSLSLGAPDWMQSVSETTGYNMMRSADQFLVRRGQGYSLLAGYPWFTDWGRDTFIAMRGLLMAVGRWDLATGILREWASTVSEGMLPNYFPDEGTQPEYNSVDAALWYCVCAGELMKAADEDRFALTPEDRQRICAAVDSILDGYTAGTRFGIEVDAEDGLLSAGSPGWQLTWMDARSDGREVTPRIGKPVEVQALWYNALRVGERWNPDRTLAADKCRESFLEKFPAPNRRGLVDVVDENHESGSVNGQLRPNQIFAVGGLPLPLLHGELAASVVEVVMAELWTPIGLRSLNASDPDYCPRYEGGRIARDAKYHQGTVWAWLAGPFIEAYLRVHPDTQGARRVESEFFWPLEKHLRGIGLGHLTEVADGIFPHQRRGCPAQAWSLGELLRCRHLLDRMNREAMARL